MNKVLLIDGLSILNRAFFGLPDLTNAEGLHTNAVLGFLNIMFKIMDEENPDYLAAAFDVSAPTFRHKMYSEYKGTRKPAAPELKEQIPLIKEVLRSMHIFTIEQEGYEADDILGTMSRKLEAQGMEVSILSGDRDLLQLATDHVKIRIPKTKKTGTQIEDYYAADVEAAYQVTPSEFIDLKALMGDPSDNIPGVFGIGEKTGIKIISTYKSIECAYAHADEIKPKKAAQNLVQYWDQAVLSKKLAAIYTQCPIQFTLQDLKLENIYTEEAYILLKRLEFKSVLTRFDSEHLSIIRNIPPAQLLPLSSDTPQNRISALTAKSPLQKGDLVGVSFHAQEPLGLCISLEGGSKNYFIPENETDIPANEWLRLLLKAGCILCVSTDRELPPGFTVPKDQLFDCSLAAYLLNPLKDSYAYDDLAEDYLSLTLPSQKDLFGKKTHRDLYEEKPELFLAYTAYCAAVPVMAHDTLLLSLQNTQMDDLYQKMELPLSYVLRSMETYGIRVKKDELKAYGDALVSRISALEEDIYALAGEQFNINSPKQLGVILFEKMHLPYAKKTKTGYSTSAEVLEKLRGEDPIIDCILEYRQLTKLKSTYADGLYEYIRADGRIHGKFHQTITATGRISSTEPNLQNIPIRMELGRLIRKVFVPEDGFIFVDADYSQIELRVLAHMSNDQQLIHAYHQEQDIHKITASQVFHTPLNEVTPQQRRNAKAVNFGIVYGISSFGLSQDLSISRKEAAAYIEQYFHTYPQVKEYLDGAVASAKELGYSVTLFGRRRPIPELKSANFTQRSFGERIAMNSPIQGTAADIIKIAMLRVYERMQKAGMRSRLILQVHDELLIEAYIDETDAVCQLLREEMEQAADLAVPLEVDIHTGKNWYEAK